MSQGAGVRGWQSPATADGGTGGLPTLEEIQDLLGAASFVSPLSTLDIAYDDAANAFEFDVDETHPFTWDAQHDFLGDGGASVSTGGSINVTTTGHTGAGVVIYSNRGADAAGRSLVVFQDNPANPQQAVRIVNDGTGHAVSIELTQTADASAEALDVISANRSDTAVGIQGAETGKGTLKVTHSHPAGAAANDDANAAILRLSWDDVAANGTAVQGIFMSSEAGGPTTIGDLMELYSGPTATSTNLRLKLKATGALQINPNTANNLGAGVQIGDAVELTSRGFPSNRMRATRYDAAGDFAFQIGNKWDDATQRSVDLEWLQADTTIWRLRKTTTDLLQLVDPTDSNFVNTYYHGKHQDQAGSTVAKIIFQTDVDTVVTGTSPRTANFVGRVTGTHDHPSGSTAIANSPLGTYARLEQTGAGVGASAVSGSFIAEAVQARNANNEIGFLLTSLENTAVGSGATHITQWNLDIGTHGVAGNEQQRGLNSVTIIQNNHYNGDPSLGPSAAMYITTKKSTGHRSGDGVDTYPNGAGIWMYGKSDVGGVFGYGYRIGLEVGGNGPYWWAAAANSSRFQDGAYLHDWGRYGLRVGSRYSGAAEANWRALLIESGHLEFSGTDSALMLPRLTTAQRDALIDITNGMLIYNTTTLQVEGRENGAWVDFHESGSVTITEVEVDFGTTPLSEKEFTIVDAAVSTSSKIIVMLAGEAPTGKDQDETEQDAMHYVAEPQAGQFILYVRGLEGYLHDKFKFWYVVG